MTKLGATGEFPEGRKNAEDEGSLVLAVGVDQMFEVRIDFGTPVSWLSMSPEQAETFANSILAQAHWAMEHRGK